jgi:hypothetical protein
MDKAKGKSKIKTQKIDEATFERATAAGESIANAPGAILRAAVGTIMRRRALSLIFRDGEGVFIPISAIQELADATPAQLRRIEVSPMRDSLRFPALDADIYVPGLISEVFGQIIRSEFARAAGRRSTPKKTRAVRENGKKGGRPKKGRRKELALA